MHDTHGFGFFVLLAITSIAGLAWSFYPSKKSEEGEATSDGDGARPNSFGGTAREVPSRPMNDPLSSALIAISFVLLILECAVIFVCCLDFMPSAEARFWLYKVVPSLVVVASCTGGWLALRKNEPLWMLIPGVGWVPILIFFFLWALVSH